jgi:hypothetical protein
MAVCVCVNYMFHERWTMAGVRTWSLPVLPASSWCTPVSQAVTAPWGYVPRCAFGVMVAQLHQQSCSL